MSQFIWPRLWTSLALSTPSATTVIPNRCARSTTALQRQYLFLAIGAAVDLTLIDFQFGERKRSYSLQSRIAATEVVDRNADVVQLQLHGNFSRQVWITDHLVLGQFDNQSGKVLITRQILAQPANKFWRFKNRDRHIDR